MKDTFDKVVMDEERKEEMRAMLGAQKVKKSKRRTWIPALAAVAALVAVLVAVPFTRNMIVSAAEALGFKRTKSGVEVSAESSIDTENSIYVFSKTIVSPVREEGNHYAQVKDGRLYCVIDDEWIDVTDQCSETEYYRKEITDLDGDKVVIYVGGTPDNKGSAEFTYGDDGKLYIAYADFDAEVTPWIESVFEKEGFKLYEDHEGYIFFNVDENGVLSESIMLIRVDDLAPSDDIFNSSDIAAIIDDATAST
ncbi:MAG: hypothetical protein IK109_08700 [Clostridiales bacterium]|nr:hypothetical protein [Clostridiales bacterium]